MYWVTNFLSRSLTTICATCLTCLASAIFVAHSDAETHTVELYDFVYAPRDIVINEGDTVLWVGVNDFHNVVSGTVNNEDGIFRSDIVNRGNTFSFTFYREVLNTNSGYNGYFPYFCEPHVDHGMVGSVTVQRVAKTLHASPSVWETTYSNEQSSDFSCSLNISASETLLSIACNTGNTTPVAVTLFEGGLTQKRAELCSLGSSVSGTCAINQGIADLLLSAQTFLEIRTSDATVYRGQITKIGGNTEVAGVVRVIGGYPLSGVSVTDGVRSTITREDGGYLLPGVPNGVYALKASKVGYTILPDIGTNPFVVNGGNTTNRNFTASPNISRRTRGDIDGDGIFDPATTSQNKLIYYSSITKNKRAIKLKGIGPVLLQTHSDNSISLAQANQINGKRIWTMYSATGNVSGILRFGKKDAKIIGGCDLQGDGATDIAVLENRILRVSPDAGKTTNILRIPAKPSDLQCQDLDSDGKSEIIVTQKTKRGVALSVYSATLDLISTREFTGGSQGFISEMDHDGIIDYAALGELKGASFILLGNGRYQLGRNRFIAASPFYTQTGTNGVLLRDSKGNSWKYHIHMRKPEKLKISTTLLH